MKKRAIAAAILELSVFAMTFGSYFNMLLFSETQAFSESGLTSLKFYTVLSNLFAGAVYLFCGVKRLSAAGKKKTSGILELLKVSSASCLGVTFVVVMVFLGPLFGYEFMFYRSNLFFHLIVPLTAAFSYVFSDPLGSVSARRAALGLIPTVLYGAVYMANVLINGSEGNDFYAFTHWGIGVGFVIFALILGLDLFIITLLRFCAAKRRKQ